MFEAPTAPSPDFWVHFLLSVAVFGGGGLVTVYLIVKELTSGKPVKSSDNTEN